MDKLKENAFALGLGGVAVVLLVLGYLLIYQKWNDVRAQTDEVNTTLSSLERYSRKPKIPTRDLVEYTSRIQQDKTQEFEEGVEFYDQSTRKFQLFFDDMEAAPQRDAFYGRYRDAVDGLVAEYQKQSYFIPVEGQEAPVLEGTLTDASPLLEDEIPRSMKEFWILQAIFRAATELELGGLRSIDFARGRSVARRSSARRGKKDEVKEEHFDVGQIAVDLTIHMRFTLVKDFLAALCRDKRVPFVDVPALTIKKPPDSLDAFKDLVRTVDEDPKSGDEKKEFDDIIPEPLVQVEMTLRALDWRGLKPGDAETQGEE